MNGMKQKRVGDDRFQGSLWLLYAFLNWPISAGLELYEDCRSCDRFAYGQANFPFKPVFTPQEPLPDIRHILNRQHCDRHSIRSARRASAAAVAKGRPDFDAHSFDFGLDGAGRHCFVGRAAAGTEYRPLIWAAFAPVFSALRWAVSR